MNVTCRPAKASDISAAGQVFSAALANLFERHGLPDQITQPMPLNPYYAFSLEREPGGFWVAEKDAEIVGMAFSWLRDSFWFLGQLFVTPTCQESGIGRKLLDKTLELGSELNITNRALITFPFNRVASALYMRYGMYPSEPIYRMVLSNVEPGGRHKTPMFTYEKVKPGSVNMGQLSAIDQHVLGIARQKHHEYFLNTPGATCYLFASDKNLEGYAYLWSNGHVGPVAVLSSNSVRGVMTEAIRLALVQGAPQVSVMIPGSNRDAIAVAFQQNFRIAVPLLLMSSQRFGDWDKYLFHSPALM